MSRSLMVLIISAFPFFTFAQKPASPQQAFIEQFQSPRIWFPAIDNPILADAPGRYPAVLNFLFEGILGWTPTGEGQSVTDNCNISVWASRLQDPRVAVSAQLQGGLMQKYLQECGSQLQTEDLGEMVNVRRYLTMRYNAYEHPFLRRVVINLPGNVKLKGLLALKGDSKRRPLVIFRSGIFSSIEDFRPERAWMMMLFEQSPFNVLLLENLTSADFIANNNQFSFGGYDEGIQNILIAQMLRNPTEPLSRVVDSVHIMGMSLGGPGVLFSSLLNKYNSPAGSPLIQSFLALCPVINLKETMESLTNSGTRSAFIDLWGRRRLRGIEEKLPGVVQYDSFKFIHKAVSEVVRTYHGGLSYINSVKLPPGMKDSEDFWGLNNFWPYYKDVSEPVMIWATDHDFMVPYAINAQKISNKVMKIDSRNIRVVEFPEGYHCTLPVAYDWKLSSSMFQSYVLSHSPHFKMRANKLNMELSDEEWKDFFVGTTTTRYKVEEPGKKKNFVNLEIELKNSKGKEKSMSFSLPLSEFDFRFHNPELTNSEKEMIVRWINQNLSVAVVDIAGKPNLQVSWAVAQ
ncbi:hypothetical protein [Bdellovibrio sp. KM01]|uniref:hypothetical protein n=1 Tax=Bdellovibrio sp. KM01 TaxID=2748865 RepID=UPI0021020163|nr:hypothetical protein [Bdellovibrio sp. KM01]